MKSTHSTPTHHTLPSRPPAPTADLQAGIRADEVAIGDLLERGSAEAELSRRLTAHLTLIQDERSQRALKTGRDDGPLRTAWDQLSPSAPLEGAGKALADYREGKDLQARVAAGGDNR